MNEAPDEDEKELYHNNPMFNLAVLCILNRKYLTKSNIEKIVRSESFIYDPDDDDEIDNIDVVPKEQYHTADSTYYSKKINNLTIAYAVDYNYSPLTLLISKYPEVLDVAYKIVHINSILPNPK